MFKQKAWRMMFETSPKWIPQKDAHIDSTDTESATPNVQTVESSVLPTTLPVDVMSIGSYRSKGILNNAFDNN